jgi:hypothetical protein
LEGADMVTPLFIAPSNISSDTDLMFRLTVTDSKNAIDIDYVKVTEKNPMGVVAPSQGTIVDTMMPKYLIHLIDTLTSQEKAHDSIQMNSCVNTKKGSMIVQKSLLQYRH